MGPTSPLFELPGFQDGPAPRQGIPKPSGFCAPATPRHTRVRVLPLFSHFIFPKYPFPPPQLDSSSKTAQVTSRGSFPWTGISVAFCLNCSHCSYCNESGVNISAFPQNHTFFQGGRQCFICLLFPEGSRASPARHSVGPTPGDFLPSSTLQQVE